MQIKSLWYRDGKWSEKRIQVSPLCINCLWITLLWLYKDLMKNLLLAVQSLLVHSKTRVTHLEGGLDKRLGAERKNDKASTAEVQGEMFPV